MRILIPALLLLLASLPAMAAEWPGNWLGLADNRYAVLDIGVYYYGAVLDDIPGEDGQPVLPGDAQEWLAQLAALPEMSEAAQQAEWEHTNAELVENRRFYWTNSRFNVVLDHHWTVDLQPRLLSSIAASDAPYYTPTEVEPIASARAKYDGILQTYVLYRYNRDNGGIERVRGGGGFTSGASRKDGKCGVSWWTAPPADNVCGSDWLQCHEFGHSIDSLFHESGHPEFWFNHLALSEANTASFMEHFDCMAYILKRVKEPDWNELHWGYERTFQDADADHVPDPDDWLAERCLQVDPDACSVDADTDGLGDFDEIVRPNGNRYGHGERLHWALKFTDPTDPDTDDDGVPDGRDQYPALPLIGNVQQLGDNPGWLEEQNTEGLLPPYDSSHPATLRLRAVQDAPALGLDLAYHLDKDLQVTAYWGEPGSGKDYECRLSLDFDNNGWFAGRDGYRIKFTTDGITQVLQSVADSHTEWPQDHTDTVDATKVGFAEVTPPAGYAYGAQITLSRELFPELAAKPGEEIGFNAGVRVAGTPWFYTITDPNTLTVIELR